MARLLLLIPTTSYRVKDFLAAAYKANVAVTVGSDAENVLSEFASSGTLWVNFEDLEGGVKTILAFNQEHPVNSIIAVDEPSSLLAAKASEQLKLPHNTFESVKTATNKNLFRKAIKDAGLPGPIFTVLKSGQEKEKFEDVIEYPCVLKPISQSASRGVIRVNNRSEFISAYDRVTKIVPDEDIIAEEFLPGQEVSVEGILINGRLTTLAIFDKPDPLDGPFFEETIYVTWSRHSDEVQGALHNMVEQAAAAIGLKEGPVHAELRLRPSESFINEQGPWVIELAARSIGGLCSRSLIFEGGGTLEELIIAHALGRPISSTEREKQASGVMMIPIPKSGIFKSTRGELAARSVKNITDVEISIKSGAKVIPLPEGNQYLGFIFAKGNSPNAVELALREAHKCLTFEIV